MPDPAVRKLLATYDISPEAAAAVEQLLDRARHAPAVAGTLEEMPPPVDLDPAAPAAGGSLTGRYEDLGPIGTGASGEVRRVRDRDLNRVMAMKIIRPGLMGQARAMARFIEEAQATAQLQHPGVVPVHEMGRLPDGRLYYTMREVRGDTLNDVIIEVHESSREGTWRAAPNGWTFRRLVDAFHKVCETVAYAHARGVVHRDLKPEHVLVGPFGEVLLLDWGLAKVLGRADLEDRVVTDRSRDASKATWMGTVAGTPAYMPPEQALGEIDRLGPHTDVYALGCILYEILCGAPPYEGRTAMAVLQQVLQGPPVPVRTRAAGLPPLPDELVATCEHAMRREPGDRFPDAGALARELGAWLEGSRKREQAAAAVAEAEAVLPVVAALREKAEASRAEAQRLLGGVRPGDPVEVKLPAWEREDEAARLEEAAESAQVRFAEILRGALSQAPDLAEARALLADHFRARHADAESRGDGGAPRFEALLRAYDDGRHADYLAGQGALTLVTDPPGAEVELFRYARRERRLVAEPVRKLGKTPLRAVSLPVGSYLLVLRAEGCEPVAYPARIGRQEHWDGVRPGAKHPAPVVLPPAGSLGADEVYVPGGWFWSGGDPLAPGSLPRRRLWCDAFVIRRYPVTVRQYLAFLDDLAKSGRLDEANLRAPGDRHEGAPPTYARDATGKLSRSVRLAQGWSPDLPVGLVDWTGALAFTRWLATRMNRPWRLPGELEWEKAARGVDGRTFPWGDALDPSWACVQDSQMGRVLPAPIDGWPQDVSPYGIRGLAGNVQEWCLDTYRREGPALTGPRVTIDASALRDDLTLARVLRGGSWISPDAGARAAARQGAPATARFPWLGFRLARSP
ncbi:MAG: SUMF1/EgtB/PvdO family nonheme iron enzyme [Myxococcota bacterium]